MDGLGICTLYSYSWLYWSVPSAKETKYVALIHFVLESFVEIVEIKNYSIAKGKERPNPKYEE